VERQIERDVKDDTISGSSSSLRSNKRGNLLAGTDAEAGQKRLEPLENNVSFLARMKVNSFEEAPSIRDQGHRFKDDSGSLLKCRSML